MKLFEPLAKFKYISLDKSSCHEVGDILYTKAYVKKRNAAQSSSFINDKRNLLCDFVVVLMRSKRHPIRFCPFRVFLVVMRYERLL